jgi:hypothetical protein
MYAFAICGRAITDRSFNERLDRTCPRRLLFSNDLNGCNMLSRNISRRFRAVFSISYLLSSGLDLAAQELHGEHGAGHDELHHWYLTLKEPGTGASCCSKQDCRPTQHRINNGAVEVEVDGEWTSVPHYKILNTPSPDLRSHVCAPRPGFMFPKGHIFCVVLGFGA